MQFDSDRFIGGWKLSREHRGVLDIKRFHSRSGLIRFGLRRSKVVSFLFFRRCRRWAALAA